MYYRVFNALIFIAMAAISVGFGMVFGVGYGLIACGSIILGMTLFMFFVAGIKGYKSPKKQP